MNSNTGQNSMSNVNEQLSRQTTEYLHNGSSDLVSTTKRMVECSSLGEKSLTFESVVSVTKSITIYTVPFLRIYYCWLTWGEVPRYHSTSENRVQRSTQPWDRDNNFLGTVGPVWQLEEDGTQKSSHPIPHWSRRGPLPFSVTLIPTVCESGGKLWLTGDTPIVTNLLKR